MDPRLILFGLGVGVLVGTAGGIQPVVAVGSDLAYAAITRTAGGLLLPLISGALLTGALVLFRALMTNLSDERETGEMETRHKVAAIVLGGAAFLVLRARLPQPTLIARTEP